MIRNFGLVALGVTLGLAGCGSSDASTKGVTSSTGGPGMGGGVSSHDSGAGLGTGGTSSDGDTSEAGSDARSSGSEGGADAPQGEGGNAQASIEPLVGDWIGTTSQGASLTFTVGPDGIAKVYVAYDGSGCSGAVSAIPLGSTPVAPILNGGFKDTETLTNGFLLGSYSVAGTFSSPSSASGVFAFDLTAISSSNCGGSGHVTWTAVPRGDAGVPCRLSNCAGTADFTFSYSCGTPSSTSSSSSSSGQPTTFKVTYSNGHIVQCESVPSDGGSRQTCSDDTGAICTW